MGATCSRDRMRCLMRAEAFISVVLFAASMYMFVMVGYFTSTSRKILSLIFGILGGLILVGGIITTSYAVTIWRDLEKGDVQNSENPEKKVRFSSLIEIHDQNPEGADSDLLDHDYEEISPPHPARGQSAKDKQAKVPDCQQGNPEVLSAPRLLQLATEDEEALQNSKLFREAYEVYLEGKNSYGTFKGIYENYPEDIVEELGNDDDEEIII